jgi:methionyl-tRNA synthetase
MLYLKPILPSTVQQAEHFLNIPKLQWQDLDKPLLSHRINQFEPLMQRVDPVKVSHMVNNEESFTSAS